MAMLEIKDIEVFYGVIQAINIVTVSYTSASETTSIDLKQLEEKEPELFNDLVKDYSKVTKRKASYSYRFK